jgi:shikimate kinase
MMGSGKSAVGQALAERLDRELVDLDALIEAGAGRPVGTIFEEEGEVGFRARESAAVRAATARSPGVLSCGGGVVLDPDNVAALRAFGTVVWLRVSPDVAARRLGDDRGRPVLRAMSGSLAQRLASLSAQREAAYRAAADAIVDADAPLDEVVEEVVAAVVGDIEL